MESKPGWRQRLWNAFLFLLETPREAILSGIRYVWYGFEPAMTYLFTRLGLWIGRLPRSRAVRVLLAICVVYSLIFYWIDQQSPRGEKIDEFVYLNQGWGQSGTSEERLRYYYSPQGAYVKGIHYDWFVNLERPWSSDRFASAKYLRGYGFIVDPSATESNPDDLPIGFARIWDDRSQSTMLDLTCAACHTGELQVVKDNKRIAVRIDGGEAMHAITSTQIGSFGNDVLFSLLAVDTNPVKWHRFSNRVLGPEHSLGNGLRLWTDVLSVATGIGQQALTEKRLHLYPTEEGYGRTDALGRIANNVFATNLSASNYTVANAPVSYPALWNVWKFDWVQYTASVAQPLARNVGQALGTGAQYDLIDRYGNEVDAQQRYRSSAYIRNLVRIESDLRDLTPPAWNEDLFGKKDQARYDQGKALFQQYCVRCHGLHYASCAQKQVEAPLKPSTKEHWKITTLPVQDIGTDKTSAFNFVNATYDLTSSGMSADEIRDVLKVYYVEQFRRVMALSADDRKQLPDSLQGEVAGVPDADTYAQKELSNIDLKHTVSGAGLNYIIALIRKRAYEDMDLMDNLYQRKVRDGFGALDIPQVAMQYRARPLEGMWATAPFLHNGSVPNLYELLLPADQRSKTFYVKGRTFDPVKVGLMTDRSTPGAFLFDTTKPGNSNTGHEFRADYQPWKAGGPPTWGVIGPELTDEQRFSIIEYVKFMKDTDFATDPASCPPPPEEEDAIDLSKKLDDVAHKSPLDPIAFPAKGKR